LEELYDFLSKPKDPSSYNAVKISLSSPEKIRERSHGEVKSQKLSIIALSNQKETACSVRRYLAYQRLRMQLWQVQRMKHRGIVCEKCGVEVIQSKVRRERMGHIELASPVAHIWFLKCLPSKIGNLLDLTLERLGEGPLLRKLHRH